MWSSFPYMLTYSILGLSVLQAYAYPSTAPLGLSQTSSTNLGQCYAYFDDQYYHISTSLQPCENICPGARTYQCIPPLNGTLYNLPGLSQVHTDPVHNGALFEIGHCICNFATKTVLPDLTSVGYSLTMQEEAGVLVVTRTGKQKGEHNAYTILRNTAFAHGLRPMSEEHEEFNKKVIDSFTIKWE